jgi:MFS family permease
MQAAPGHRRFGTGLATAAGGLLVLAAGVQATALWPFLIGGAIAGAGGGILFKSAVATVAGMSAPHERGETLAGLFLFGYLGLILPVLGLGIATQFVAATTAMLWFAGLMVALLAGIALLRHSPSREIPARD